MTAKSSCHFVAFALLIVLEADYQNDLPVHIKTLYNNILYIFKDAEL